MDNVGKSWTADLAQESEFILWHSPDQLRALVMCRINHALLSEPAISMALHKTRSLPVSLVAPELHRSVDLQRQWGEPTGGEVRIPQVGLAVLGATREDAELVARVEAAYENSAFSCFEQPVSCGKMVARRIDLLGAEAVADSLLVLSRYHASSACSAGSGRVCVWASPGGASRYRLDISSTSLFFQACTALLPPFPE
ncbi:hypothetical protein [Billgrantia endophytica]|uniref:Uncharacterized protein n=1 Tax=Billgrantia endophytica TaxID=2033802 RepID=A0A2N7U9X2_9GAMM|nr:hypothetical protein [Halomonas endophytica]PMR77239.1 hypothetical protein C1H69_03525 [Halomonas endophytica]